MYWYIASFIAGCVLGGAGSAFLFAGIHHRFCLRLYKHANFERACQELEQRRDAYDSGRDTEALENAGNEGDQANLFTIRPGVMYLNKLQEQLPENRWKTFDTSGIPRSIDSARVTTDQQISPNEGQ